MWVGWGLSFNLVHTSPEEIGWVPGPCAGLLSLRFVQLDLFFSHCLLAGKECKHRSDNQSVCSFLSVTSSKPHLQKEAAAIYNLCHKTGIHFSAEWIPRYSNVKADYWSKIVNTDDWIFCGDPTSWTVLLVIIFSTCQVLFSMVVSWDRTYWRF